MKIHIISKDGCTYCEKAKAFMKEKDIPYVLEESIDTKRLSTIKRETGKHTFPYIFVHNKDHTYIGGYKELVHSYNTLKLKQLGFNYILDF